MTEEMNRLRQLLRLKKIEWIDRSDPADGGTIHIDRTFFMHETGEKTHFVSVIHGSGTYGGISLNGDDKGLLEIQIDRRAPRGCLTADEIMKMIEQL